MAEGLGSEGRAALSNLLFKAFSLPFEKGCRVLLVLLSAPVLGKAAFGRFQFAATVTTLLAVGTDLGLGIWTTRALARSRARAPTIVATGLGLRTLAALPYAVVAGVVALLAGSGEMRATFLFLGVAALANAYEEHFGAILRGYERLDDEARLNVLRAALTAGAGLWALVHWGSMVALAAGVMVGTVAGLFYGLWMLGRRYRLLGAAARDLPSAAGAPGGGGFDRALARSATREALPLWLASLLSLLYFRGDTVLLWFFSGAAELGTYSAAYKVLDGAMILPAILLSALFPPLARAHGDRERQAHWERVVVTVLLALGIAVGLGMYLGSPLIIRLAFTSEFARAVPSLRVLAFAVPFIYFNFGLTHFLIARDLGQRNLLFAALMLVLNTALNLLAIPRWGGPGAAFATVGTEVALTACCLIALGWRWPRSADRQQEQSTTKKARMSG
jgi:O-antigen/teichoic acid export membrane protein